MSGLDDLIMQLALGNAQKQMIAESDPYVGGEQIADQVAGLVAQSGPQYSTKDKIIYGALSGLIGGGFKGLSDDYRGRAENSYLDVMLNSANNKSVSPPPVLSTGLFNAAKQQGSLFALQRALQQGQLADEIQKVERIEGIKGDIALRQSIIQAGLTNPATARRIAAAGGVDALINGGLGSAAAPVAPVQASDAVTVVKPEVKAPLTPKGGVNISIDPIARYNELLDQGADEVLARQTVDKETERIAAQRADAIKWIAEQSAALAPAKKNLDDLSIALSGAGETGGVGPTDWGRGVNLGIQSLFGSESAKKRIAARAEVDSLALQAAGEIRKMFPGDTSGKEFERYLSAVAGTGRSPEANKAFFDRLVRGYSQGRQKIDFVQRATNEGIPLNDAIRLYDEYDAINPLFQNGELNPARADADINSIDLAALASGQMKPAPIAAPQLPVAPQTSLAQDAGLFVRNRAQEIATAGANFGDQALFGLPSRAVAAASALGNEIGETLSGQQGTGRSFMENYAANLGEGEQAMQQAAAESPIVAGVSNVAGAIASPVNKLKAVQAAYKMGGIPGIFARTGVAATTAAADAIKSGKSPTQAVQDAGMFSALLEIAAPGVKKLAKPAADVLRSLTGITSENFRKVAKGLSKGDMLEAKRSFQRGYDIIKKEHGVKVTDLIQSDENTLQGLAKKSIDSITKRIDEVDTIVDDATAVMNSSRGAKGQFAVKPKPIALTGAALANSNRAITKAGAANGPAVKAERDRIIAEIKRKYPKGITLRNLQDELRALNPFYKLDAPYKDAVTSLADDFRGIIQRNIDKLAKSGRLPAEAAGRVKSLNLEVRDLMRLRDGYASKLPGAMAQDLISSGQRALFTTGGAATQGAANVGEAVAGQTGRTAAITAAVIAYSKRLGRPVASVLENESIANFLASPEARSALIEFEDQTGDARTLPDFSVPQIGSKKKVLTATEKGPSMNTSSRSDFDTPLSTDEESKFSEWVNKISKRDGRDRAMDLTDYDLRGYFKELKGALPPEGHYPDTYKKPNHPTFSNESIYNGAKLPDGTIARGGTWNGDKFIPQKKNIALIESEIDADPYYSALYEAESNRNPQAVPRDKTGKLLSSAKGGFQFLDDTAKRIGLKDPFDLAESFDAVKKLTTAHDAVFGTDPAMRYAAHYLGQTVLSKYIKGEKLTEKEAAQIEYLENTALPRYMKIYNRIIKARSGAQTA